MTKKTSIYTIILFAAGLFYFFQTTNNDLETTLLDSKDSIAIDAKSQVFFLYPKLKNNQLIKHSYYALSYGEKDEQAEWVAYRLYKNSVNDSTKRKDNFSKDTTVVFRLCFFGRLQKFWI